MEEYQQKKFKKYLENAEGCIILVVRSFRKYVRHVLNERQLSLTLGLGNKRKRVARE